MPSDLEAAFATLWRSLGGPEMIAEYRFDPVRRWRFDFAHPVARVAVELEGGTFSGGRHVRGKGFEDDACKYNAAAAAGWAVFRLTGRMLNTDPVGHLSAIKACIERRQEIGS